MSWRTYDQARAEAYDCERRAPDEHLAEVRDVLLKEIGSPLRALILDVGAGTGLWSDRLARWLSAPVVAVEPSAGMVAVLAAKRLAGVSVVRARAEALPFGDASCGAAWLSTMVHHVEELAVATAEVARVLTRDGVAMVRSAFPGEPSADVLTTRFFPTADAMVAGFPTLPALVRSFAAAGLELVARHAPREVRASTRTEYARVVQLRADSVLRGIDDDAFDTGLERLHRWSAEAPDERVYFTPDLLVFRAEHRPC